MPVVVLHSFRHIFNTNESKGAALCDQVDDNVLYRIDEVVPFLLLQYLIGRAVKRVVLLR